MGNGPVEPAANLRQAAAALYGIFVALTDEGFSEKQALAIIGHMLVAQQGGEQ